MAVPEKPQILLLSLAYRDFFDEVYSGLINNLFENAHVKRVKTAPAALRTITETPLQAIIITDEGLTQSNRETREVLSNIKTYVQNGGLVIVGLHFPSFTRPNNINQLFQAFNLPWKAGDYNRTTFQLNPSGVLPEGTEPSSLPGPYSMKALHIDNAEPQQKLFVPAEGAVTQSLVFSPMSANRAQAGVAGAKIGRGHLFYCGDVNGEEESNRLMAALCGI